MKKLLMICLLLAAVLAACGGNPKPAGTPVVIPRTPSLPAYPTNPPGCSDSASFVEDVTVPDNTPFPPQEIFEKTWRLKNTGTCAWNRDYHMVFASGEQMGAPTSTPLEFTAPGNTLDISMEMRAPAGYGSFVANFELRAPDGETIPVDNGKYIWVAIVVSEVVMLGTPTINPATPSVGTVLPLDEMPCAYTTNPDFINQTLALINSQRAAHDLPALTLNWRLTTAAQGHAADMACNSYLSHIGSNGSDIEERVLLTGYTPSLVLETIYAQAPKNGGTPASAVQWWMSDLIHRRTILHPKITEIGVGYAFFPDSQMEGYWSVVFAAP